MLRPITKFSLEKHAGPYHTWGTSSALCIDGVLTGKQVPGFLIEGQYARDDLSVLITSYDCPFEEAQNFLLLNAECNVISELFLGQMFGSYLLMKNYLIGDGEVALEFAGYDVPWILHVDPNWWPANQKMWLQRPSCQSPVKPDGPSLPSGR